MLRPGLSLAWRSADSLQLGIEDPRPIIVTGLPPETQAALELMDGTRTYEEVISALVGSGPTDGVRQMIDRLQQAGAIVDGGRWPGGSGVSSEARARLLPDLMAGAPDDPDHWWHSLAHTHVTVVGASRLGSILACSLASAGVGRVTVEDSRPVTDADVAWGGFAQSDVGHRRCDLLANHPELQALRPAPQRLQRLHVLTDAVDVDARARALTGQGATYLVASSRERMGRVGPLVVPGSTACLFCIHLHRRDHDPAWPHLWRQRSWDATPVAHSVTVAITAHTAAASVLSWAIGGSPPAMRGLVEIEGDGASRFLAAPPHPECGCTWSDVAAS